MLALGGGGGTSDSLLSSRPEVTDSSFGFSEYRPFVCVVIGPELVEGVLIDVVRPADSVLAVAVTRLSRLLPETPSGQEGDEPTSSLCFTDEPLDCSAVISP